MKGTLVFIVLLLIAVSTIVPSGIVSAQGVAQISVVTLDSETFVTVQETGTGDMLSLYRIRGDRIYLVDTVFNSTSRDVKLPRRYLHHIEVDNR